MAPPLVDFVVCTWNNRAIVGPTLEAVERQTARPFTCTVVDDRSDDGTPEWIARRFPWVHVIVKPANTGPASSRNLGFAAGAAPYVVFLDSDVRLEPQWAARQIEILAPDERTAAVCGKLLYGGQPDVLYGAYGTMNRYGVAWDGGFRRPAAEFTGCRRCLWANTTAMAVRRDAARRIGEFDAAMFTMQEDVDFGWRANLFGYRVLFNPDAVAVHDVHGSLDPDTMSERLIHLVWRNRLRSILINNGAGHLARRTLPFVVLACLDGAVYGPRRAKLGALAWNLRMLRDTWRRRRWVQAQRVVGDGEIDRMLEDGVRGPGYGIFPGSRQARAVAAS